MICTSVFFSLKKLDKITLFKLSKVRRLYSQMIICQCQKLELMKYISLSLFTAVIFWLNSLALFFPLFHYDCILIYLIISMKTLFFKEVTLWNFQKLSPILISNCSAELILGWWSKNGGGYWGLNYEFANTIINYEF